MYVVKTDSEGLTTPNVIPFIDPLSVPTHTSSAYSIHPNPVTPSNLLNIKTSNGAQLRSITLTDLSGRVVAQERCTGCNSYTMPQLASGMYRIVLELNDGAVVTRPLVVE
jgi:hypothetical protein